MFHIFDNGGVEKGGSIDRYTIVFEDGDLYASDEHPFHPQGYCSPFFSS